MHLPRTATSRHLTTSYRPGGGGGDQPHRPITSASSHRFAQLLANTAASVPRLTCNVNDQGHIEIWCPHQLDHDMWLSVRTCLDALSGQNTAKISPYPSVIVIEPYGGHDAEIVSRYLEAVHASICLLLRLGMMTGEAARVLRRSPGIVGFAVVHGPELFTLNGVGTRKPPIARLAPTVIIQITIALAEADQSEAGCKFLNACHPTAEHVKLLLLSGHASVLGHWYWSGRKDKLFETLKRVREDLLHGDTDAWCRLVAGPSLPDWMRPILAPLMPEDVNVKAARKAAREAATALLSAWVSTDLGSTSSCQQVLLDLVGEEPIAMSRLLDLARVLADACPDDLPKKRLAEALTGAACIALATAWGGGADDVFDFLTEIPEAHAVGLPRTVRPLLQCVLIAAILGRGRELRVLVPRLGDIENQHWSDTEPALADLLDETAAALAQVQKQFPEIVELGSVRQMLRKVGVDVRTGLGIQPVPTVTPAPQPAPEVLKRIKGCKSAKKQFQQLCARLAPDGPVPLHIGVTSRLLLIERALDQIQQSGDIGIVMAAKQEAPEQWDTLNSLLDGGDGGEFLRWLAFKAGYAVVRAVIVQLLGPTLQLKPAELYEMLMARSDVGRFGLAVALCPLVWTLQPDGSASKLVDLLLKEWSYRPDAPTLLLEALLGPQGEHTWPELLTACKARKMYELLRGAPLLQQLFSGRPNDWQQCIDQLLENCTVTSRRRLLMIVAADCALQCDLRSAARLKALANRLSDELGFGTVFEFEPVELYEVLRAAQHDPWLRAEFCILTGRFHEGRDLLGVRHLCREFPSVEDDQRLRALIFGSKLSPLSGSLEEMTADECRHWQKKFSDWLSEVCYGSEWFLRICSLILSQLIGAKLSEATVLHILKAMEAEANLRRVGQSFAADLEAFRCERKAARKRDAARNENTRIALTLPELPHAHLRSGVPSLKDLGGDKAVLANTIGLLIGSGLLEAELQLLLARGMEQGLAAGIAQPNLLLALLFKPGLFDGYRQPSPHLLKWLGQQCCAWPAAGTFVRFLYEVLSDGTSDPWSPVVDVQQLGAFLSGVLQSTLDYVGRKKNFQKIQLPVARLIDLVEGLILTRCEPKDLDALSIRHCKDLLQSLRERASGPVG